MRGKYPTDGAERASKPAVRRAMIDGGGAAHRALRAPGAPLAAFEALPVGALAETDLEAYDVVLVPRSCDAEALLARRHQVRRFLDRGGVLIAFGELWTGWLPGARWEPESHADVAAAPRLASHPLLEGFGADDVWWHRDHDWCCHGHIWAPPGAETLVRNGDDAAWCYIDRVTTVGTIFAASNLDLDTHTFHGNQMARLLLDRVLAWADSEAEQLASRRVRRPERIAGYFSGVNFQRGFFEGAGADAIAIVPAAEFGAFDLDAYPALWVPRESDQRTLAANRAKIERYLEAGGRVLCFEELDRDWLPGARWERARVDLNTVRMDRSSLVRAFGELARPWHAHGGLRLSLEADVHITAENGLTLLASYRVGAGSVLAGTLDPDAHAGFGSTRPNAALAELFSWAHGRAVKEAVIAGAR